MKKLLLLLILSFLSAQGYAATCPDGSDPVKSLSDDGSYFLFNCKLGYPDGELQEPIDYSLSSAKADYFKKLVKNEMYLSAQKLFKKYEYTYFLKKSAFSDNRPFDDLKKEFEITSEGIRKTFEPEILEHINLMKEAYTNIASKDTSPESQWNYYKQLLKDSHKLSLNYLKKNNRIVGLMVSRDNSSKPKRDLKSAEDKLRNSLKKQALMNFKSYDIVNKLNFFSSYPISLSSSEEVNLLSDSSVYIISIIEKVPDDKATQVIKKYNLDTLKTPIKINLLASQFQSYSIDNSKSFFDAFSLTTEDEIKVINASSDYLLAILDSSSTEQVVKIIRLYGLNRPEVNLYSKLPQTILKKIVDQSQPKTKDILEIIQNMNAIGIREHNLLPDEYLISVFKVTSKYQKEPIVKASDLLKRPSKNIQNFINSPYIITVQSRVSSVDISEDDLKKIQSQYKASSSLVSNSKYSRLQSSYQRASNEYDSAVQEYNNLKQWATNLENEAKDYANSYQGPTSFTCNTTYQGSSSTSNCRDQGDRYYSTAIYAYDNYIGSAFWGLEAKVNKLKSRINRAKNNRDSYRSQLASTPSQISKDNYKNYSFTTRTFDVLKNIKRDVYLINTKSNTFSGFNFDHSIKKNFVFANGLDLDDKSYSQNNYQTDADVEIFLNKPDSFSLDKLIELIPFDHSSNKLEGPIEEVLSETIKAFESVTRTNSNQNSDLSIPEENSQENEVVEQADFIEKIKEAKSLFDSGIISQEEFDKIKQKIIENI